MTVSASEQHHNTITRAVYAPLFMIQDTFSTNQELFLSPPKSAFATSLKIFVGFAVQPTVRLVLPLVQFSWHRPQTSHTSNRNYGIFKVTLKGIVKSISSSFLLNIYPPLLYYDIRYLLASPSFADGRQRSPRKTVISFALFFCHVVVCASFVVYRKP